MTSIEDALKRLTVIGARRQAIKAQMEALMREDEVAEKAEADLKKIIGAK
jgi:hypothetical protein